MEKKLNKGRMVGGCRDLALNEDPSRLLAAFSKQCHHFGVTPTDSIVRSLMTDNVNVGKQIIVCYCEGDEAHFGPGASRALVGAVTGIGVGLPPSESGEPMIYSALTDLRIWNSNVGDEGTAALADMLRFGGKSLRLSMLELMHCRVGPVGALALGKSLSCAMNTSLTILRLDHNSSIKNEGMSALCLGLRTNSTLKDLSVQYCNLNGKEGGDAVSELLSFKRSALATLNLAGNQLGGKGLSRICDGLSKNTCLLDLNLASNGIIGSIPQDVDALKKFALLLAIHPTVVSIDLMHNNIGNEGGRGLLSYRENGRIEVMKVDPKLDASIYDTLVRNRKVGKDKKIARKKK